MSFKNATSLATFFQKYREADHKSN